MSALQKRLKLLSFGLMVVAILQIVAGILLLVASPLVAGLRIEVPGGTSDGVIVAEAIGALGILVGAYCLIVGVLGARTANNPRKPGTFKALDLVLVVAAVVEFALGISSGQVAWVDLLLVVLGILAYATAVRANREAVDKL